VALRTYLFGMAACPSCGRENADDARFCSGCGEALVARRPERRKVATLLFCDVVGSTALTERVDPEAVREIMVRYFEQSRVVIERHGGTVEKFVGDAVMAVFGVPVAHEDDAMRAVRAAWELQAEMAELNQEFPARRWAIPPPCVTSPVEGCSSATSPTSSSRSCGAGTSASPLRPGTGGRPFTAR
jgi:hypothetical protein